MLNGRAINTLYYFGCVSMARNDRLSSWQKDIKHTIYIRCTVPLDNNESCYILSVNSDTRCLLDSKYSPNDVLTIAMMSICASFFMRLFIISNAPTVSL